MLLLTLARLFLKLSMILVIHLQLVSLIIIILMLTSSIFLIIYSILMSLLPLKPRTLVLHTRVITLFSFPLVPPCIQILYHSFSLLLNLLFVFYFLRKLAHFYHYSAFSSHYSHSLYYSHYSHHNYKHVCIHIPHNVSYLDRTYSFFFLFFFHLTL